MRHTAASRRHPVAGSRTCPTTKQPKSRRAPITNAPGRWRCWCGGYLASPHEQFNLRKVTADTTSAG